MIVSAHVKVYGCLPERWRARQTTSVWRGNRSFCEILYEWQGHRLLKLGMGIWIRVEFI